MASFKPFIVLLFIIHYVYRSEAVACVQLDSDLCELESRCQWSGSECFCASQVPLDVMFFMDESGSMSSTNYISEKNFVIDMIEKQLTDESHAYVFKFSDGVRSVWKFWYTQWPRDKMKQAILGASYARGGTYMKTALAQVKKKFKAWETTKASKGYEGFQRLVVFLTDGKPYPSSESPCDIIGEVQEWVGEENILVVGMGGFDEASIKCMVTPGYPNGVPDMNRIMEVDSFTPSAFLAARMGMDEFLCPRSLSLKLTEISIESFSNGPDTHHSRFIEIFNNGIELDFSESANSLTFEGFMSSTFGYDGDSSCTQILGAGQYLVLYDPASPDIPACLDCNCTKNADLHCTDPLSIYLPCGSTSNGCGTCTWDLDPLTASNDKWTQTVKETFTGGVLSTATRESQTATGWTKVFTGYTTELKQRSYNTDEPTSWAMSCTGRGTPGTFPLNPCRAECIADVCKTKGDNATYCHPTEDLCVCTVASGWYLPDGSPSCVQLATPINCTVVNVNDADLGLVSTIKWKKGSQDNDDSFFEVTDAVETVTKTGLEALKQYEIPGGTTVTVRAVYDDRLQGLVYSEAAVCTVDTAEPTPGPTRTPTESNADIDSCTATVEEYNVIRLSWTDAYQAQTHDIAGPYKYYVYGNWHGGSTSPSTEISTVITSATTETLYVPTPLDPLDIETNGAPDIWVVTVIPHPETGANDYDLMTTDGAGKVKCTIVTQSPTPGPTKSPTKDPSESPSKFPTKYPTLSPTYGAWVMDTCSVTIPARGDLAGGTPLSVRFTYHPEANAQSRAYIQFFVNDEQKGTASTRGDGTAGVIKDAYAQPAGITQDDVDTAMAADKFEARIKYDHQDGVQVYSNLKTCEFTTQSPTLDPTTSPSKDPSASPSDVPSISPTEVPSQTPTTSPTFEALTLDPCSAELDVEKTGITVTFTETTFDDDDVDKKYPLRTDIYYTFRVGPSSNDKYHPDGGDVISQVASTSQAEATVPIELPANFQFEIDKTYVTIDIADGLGDSSLPITCALVTQRPTPAPTTPKPTPFPTTENPIVRLDLLDASNNVKDWGFEGECMNLGLDDETRRRRLEEEEEEEEEDVELVNNCPYCPICTVKEDINIKYLRIIREPADFPYDVLVKFKVSHLADNEGGGMSADDFDYKLIDRNWHNLFKGHAAFQKAYIVGGPSGNTIEIPYYLEVDDDPEDTRETLEAFEVRVKECEIDESGGATNPMDAELKGIYNCAVGAYYSAAIIMVEQPPESDTFITSKVGELPKWVWAPIGFAAVAIPFVAYLIYRFYRGRKAAEKMEVQRTFELGKAEEQDDVAEFGVRGDLVTANPLATGAAFEVDKGDVAIQKHLEIEKMNFEMATTEVEHNIFKQDFGPVQAEKHDMDAPAMPETSGDGPAETAD